LPDLNGAGGGHSVNLIIKKFISGDICGTFKKRYFFTGEQNGLVRSTIRTKKNVEMISGHKKNLQWLCLYGPTIDAPLRAPTLSFTVEGKHPAEMCR